MCEIKQLLYCNYAWFPCCLKKKKYPLIQWSEDEENRILQYILTDISLTEIIIRLKKSRAEIERKITILMKQQPNYEPVYHMGPGTNYTNYIQFIKQNYQYVTL